jgi:hypothetical protein
MALVHSPSIVTSGLALYLDAGNVKSYPGSGTTWSDLSGNGNNGTLVNAPGFDTANGGSILFNGTINYVTLPNGILSGTGDFAVNQWVKSLSVGGTGTTFANYSSGNLQIFYGAQYVGVYLGAAFYACSSTPCAYYNSGWNMITALRSGTSIGFYLNGASIKTGTTSNSIGTISASFRLGTNTIGTEQFTGNIAVTQVYNRTLSQTEISQNFNALRGRYNI